MNIRVPKIYKIVDITDGRTYIGSTKQHLISSRMTMHRTENNKCSSKQIIKDNNYYYKLVEECTLDNIKERERFHINNTENCINIQKLNGLDKERKNLRDKLAMREKRKYWKQLPGIINIDVNLFN
tara:strand:- start:114 stop:491 length:378 start_codon:yes stop_codon:yes gene_type:complete